MPSVNAVAKMMNKLKFGLVGAGGIAQAYAQAFNESGCCNLAAVSDVRPEAAAALAEIVGAKTYSSYQELADLSPDAVIVATPPSTHAEIACFFLERGISVLCEKPLTTNIADAEKMIATAEKAGVQFTMASKFRYSADVIKAKSLLASGILGDVLQFENAFTAKVDMSKRWNSEEAVSGGGVLIDGCEFSLVNNVIAVNGSGNSLFGGLKITNIATPGLHELQFNTITDNAGLTNAITGVECASILTPLAFANNIVYANPVTGTGTQVGGDADCTWTYSDIGPQPVTGEGNVNEPPLFVDVATRDFHLQPTSPVRDLADEDATVTIDIDGDARPQGARADMGADEIVD